MLQIEIGVCFRESAGKLSPWYNRGVKSTKIIPSKIQQEIILGCVLGDGSLEFNGYRGTRLQIKQSASHKDYVLWLYDKLGNLCRSEPQEKKDTGQWYFSTRALAWLTSLQKVFYRQRKKVIPKNISELLVSPLTIAVWYMDDGSLDFRPKDHYAFMLHTDSFLLEEARMLVKTVERNFGLRTSVYNSLCRGVRYPKIYIGSEGRDRFLALIKPYILDCFKYKLPQIDFDPSETDLSAMQKVR